VHCGTHHYDPGTRKKAVTWSIGTRVRILPGAPEYTGKKALVHGVNAETVTVQVPLGRRPGDHDFIRVKPQFLRKLPTQP
jgi:hypothetical protein